MTVKHLIDCANLASVRLRFFHGSNPNTLKQIPGKKFNHNEVPQKK